MHAYFMQRALALARRGWYTTRPNPRVGCVLVAGDTAHGTVIGEGCHERAGGPHAERQALADAREHGATTQNATVYITLEPCSHTGRTPPCVDALIEAGVARVVLGAVDPNPAVDGRGIAALRDAGIEVITGVLTEACAQLNPGFNMRMRRNRPRVRVKLAMSLDGRTAAADGNSRWITGEPAREDVHRLRAESGAVMVGRATAIADDPALNVRLPGTWDQPLRVVLDTDLQTPPAAKMLALDGQTHIFTASTDAEKTAALEAAGARIVPVTAGPGGVDLPAVLRALAMLEINDVLVEAGPTLAGALAVADWVDEYVIYMAPLLLGDAARGLLRLPGVTGLGKARWLTIDTIEPVGDDWCIHAYPAEDNN
jgi:diaminohydroxyphosphoribosylaminopyrimidine deaminase/5-amino-6-(5-phosphoribosylamino)uracil reductase